MDAEKYIMACSHRMRKNTSRIKFDTTLHPVTCGFCNTASTTVSEGM